MSIMSSFRARGAPFERFIWRLDTTPGLVAMFTVALLLRVAIAPHVGFYFDLHYFQTWAGELARVGPHNIYSVDHAVDYPPGYLYVLWLIGKISATPGYLLIKLPAILGDLGLAWIAGTFAERLAPSSMKERLPLRAVVAAAVLFNPAVIALSTVWGQVDVVPTFFVLTSLFLLFTGRQSLGRETAAFLLFAVAFAMKPQTSFALPVLLYALYRRYLHRRSRVELFDGVLSIALIGVASLGFWFVSGLPFGLGPVSLVHFYSHSASVHRFTSSNAFNFWGVVGSWRNDSTGFHVMKIAGIPALRVGMLLFAIALVVVLWRTHRAVERGANEARLLTLAAAVTSLLGYTLLTRMHERYMFIALALFVPLIFNRPLRWTYAALSLLLLLNLWFAYAYYNVQVNVQALKFEPWYRWIFGGFAFDTWQKRLISLVVTAIAIAVAWRGIGWIQKGEPELESAGVSPQGTEPASSWTTGVRNVQTAALTEPVMSAKSKQGVLAWTPLTLVGLASVFSLTILRGETRYAENLNDSALHLLMVRWASGQFHEGRVPFDGWFPYFSLGSSFFHHYQSLPHTLTGFLANLIGAPNQTMYLWVLYLFLALWPISVYIGARLLEWGTWTAGAAAAISPLLVSTPGYGYEHGSYTWQGYGIYGQLWAMWLLPITWGLTWRAVARGKHYAAAAAALALTIACHFITGYLAVLTVGVWVVVLGKSGFRHRVGRAALATVGGLLVAAWVLVPLIGDTKWSAQSEYYKGTIFNDSYGAQKILGWLFTGQIFDAHRFPIITVLVFVGVLVCLARARTDLRARALLGAFTLSLLLFFGRRTWGSLIDLLPGFRDVQIHRFIMGVHLAGILLGGVGLSWVLRTASSLVLRRWRAQYAVALTASLLLCVGVLAPAWIERVHYDRHGAALIRSQQRYDATDGRDLDRLVAIVKARHDGRVYAGLRANWGQQYRVGSVPVYAWLADRSVDEIGFVFRTITSLSTDVEVAFDEDNPAQYQMLNIRYLILPSNHRPPVPAKLLASSGRHRLYEVQTSGYFQVVDRAPPVSANRTSIEHTTKAFRNSSLASQGVYPSVAFAGAATLPPTYAGKAPPAGSAGAVLAQSNTLQNGRFDATVRVNRPAVVLLKATYDPRWTVKVDGIGAKTEMMAPSLVGVEVPVGRHVVRFRYAPYRQYVPLLAIGALTLVALVLFPRRARLRRRLAALRGSEQRPKLAGARDT
jgi:Gpi18-like mannosyltransferase